MLAVLARPAIAEPRWLACKYSDTNGKPQSFFMVLDDLRNVASLLDGGTLVEGADTGITFQALRTRFPQFTITYNRNDGALAVTPLAGYGGIRTGECRRSPPPPGAPNPP
ncbi:MAG: hypothetical protein ACXU9B_19120 [Reyranella sp.]